MVSVAQQRPFETGLDVSSADFWSRSLVDRDVTFAWLRANAPVSWHPPHVTPLSPENHGQAGFWAVTRASDIQYVSSHHELFSSELGGVSFRVMDPSLRSVPTFLDMDPPQHNWHRNVISPAFTPKGVARLSAKIEERAEEIVGAVVGAGDFDFVDRVSSQLPMLTVADMVGVPEREIPAFTQAGNYIVLALSPDGADLPDRMTALELFRTQQTILKEIGLDLVRHRREHPADDIATALAFGQIEGRPIDDGEIGEMMVLLSVAGNDTTKHTTSWTALSLCRNPEQRAWLQADFHGRIAQAVDEFVRHASPVMMFARTATTDTELAGREITKGDKVVMFYCSGNRDESLFPDPHRFDLSRPRASHVAFGGKGVHFCLGNVVAKAQLRAIFKNILTKLPGLQITAEPVPLRSDFINGIQRLGEW